MGGGLGVTLNEQVDIVRAAADVSGTGVWGAEKKDVPLAFCYLMPHISKITVSIFEDGISDRMEPDKHYEFRIDRPLDRDYYAEYQRYMANLRQKNSPATDQSTQDRKELE